MPPAARRAGAESKGGRGGAVAQTALALLVLLPLVVVGGGGGGSSIWSRCRDFASRMDSDLKPPTYHRAEVGRSNPCGGQERPAGSESESLSDALC